MKIDVNLIVHLVSGVVLMVEEVLEQKRVLICSPTALHIWACIHTYKHHTYICIHIYLRQCGAFGYTEKPRFRCIKTMKCVLFSSTKKERFTEPKIILDSALNMVERQGHTERTVKTSILTWQRPLHMSRKVMAHRLWCWEMTRWKPMGLAF